MSVAIIDQVCVVVTTTFGDPTGQVTPAATFRSLNLDSLDQVELVMAIEDHFDIRIADTEADKLAGITDAALLVERKLTEKRDA